ncbi:hypothetical protein [Ligilactobacillus salivarius]|uniref:hypothetical protein n=2 Tax=Ligilactobacillus salivarius TaxID=1624 RepID=UPI001369A817|nr:hypothetical protein [Ligilactobacillus salivarius]
MELMVLITLVLQLLKFQMEQLLDGVKKVITMLVIFIGTKAKKLIYRQKLDMTILILQVLETMLTAIINGQCLLICMVWLRH